MKYEKGDLVKIAGNWGVAELLGVILDIVYRDINIPGVGTIAIYDYEVYWPEGQVYLYPPDALERVNVLSQKTNNISKNSREEISK